MSASGDSATPSARQQLRVFFCYAREDDDLRRELLRHLSILRHSEMISAWYDGEIIAGQEWEKEIRSHLALSHIVILLVSPSFVSSDYCYNVEMKHALERHEAGEARVIPVILRPVDWEGAPFAKLQMLPRDAKPVTKWSERDEALVSVAQGVRAAVIEMFALNELSRGESTAQISREQIERRRFGPRELVPNSDLANAIQEKRLEYLEHAYEDLQSAYSRMQLESEAEREERPALLAELTTLRAALAKKDKEQEENIEKLKSTVNELQTKLRKKEADYDRLLDDARAKVGSQMERIKELSAQVLESSGRKRK